MTDLDYVLHEPLPPLRDATMVVMLTGWIDASGAAAAAMALLLAGCNSTLLATFDSDRYIDYRARRPTMELRDGVNARLVWSDIYVHVGTDQNGHDIVLLSGPEPDSQWRRFAQVVADLGAQLGVTRMVAVGSYPFAAPHTRVARLSSSSPSADVSATLPYLKNSVDVPAGAAAALEHAFNDRGIDAMGIWVQVPHYVSTMPYPAGTLALLSGLREVAEIEIDSTGLATETADQRIKLDQLVSGNDEHRAMVQQLEEIYDTSAQQTLSLGHPEVPTGDELAAELERFLRDQEL